MAVYLVDLNDPQIGTVQVQVGDRLSLNLLSADTETGTVSINIEAGALPTGRLTSANELLFLLSPDDVGEYEFLLVARSGEFTSRQTVKLQILADPVKTTRVSRMLNNIGSRALAGIDLAIGSTRDTTDNNGKKSVQTTDPKQQTKMLIF